MSNEYISLNTQAHHSDNDIELYIDNGQNDENKEMHKINESDSLLSDENEPMIPKNENQLEDEPITPNVEEIVKPKPKRVYWVDLLRVFACYLVIMTHSSKKFIKGFPKVGTYDWKMLTAYNALARPCVPFFIMISGIFFLNPNKKITIKQIFSKYVFRILKGYFFWSIYYNVIERYFIYYNPNVHLDMNLVKYALTRIILGGGHALWYLNFVIGLYICTPIIKKITSDREIAWYAVIIFSITSQLIPTVGNILEKYYDYPGLAKIIRTYNDGLYLEIAGNYTTFYILGYLLSSKEIKRRIYIYLYYIVGVLGLFLTFFYRYKMSYKTKRNDFSVAEFYSFNVVMMTVGAFMFFKYTLNHIIEPLMNIEILKKILMSFSECSFGMYLIHMAILRAYNYFGISILLHNTLFWVPIYALIVYLTCFIIIFLLRKISFFRIVT